MLASDAYFLFSRTDLFQKVLYFPTSEMLSVAKLSIIKPKIRPRPQHLTQKSDIAFSATKASWRILRRATRRTMPGIQPCLSLQTNNHLGPVFLTFQTYVLMSYDSTQKLKVLNYKLL